MSVGEGANVNDKVSLCMSNDNGNKPKQEEVKELKKSEYGLVLNVSEKTAKEGLRVALTMKKTLNKPVVLIIK